ncbi:MAG: LemA family protein [Saprospiraceae bacterium]|nr:LemA family protein [Saprospiraceae bacterium]
MKNSLVFIALAAFIFFYGGCKYNGLVKTDEGVKLKWGNVQSEYQRRMDLIPNIVEAVRGEANFEKSVLEGVINARASATKTTIDASNLTPEKIKEVAAVQGQFGQAIGRLLSVSEQYPNLKSNAAFSELRSQLEGTENRIKVARNEFNASVKDYNVSVRSFPASIFASVFGFSTKPEFQAELGSDKAPSLKGAFDPKPAQ